MNKLATMNQTQPVAPASHSKRKITFCLPNFCTGGVERVLVIYLNLLLQTERYDITVLFTGLVEDSFLLSQIDSRIKIISLNQFPTLKPSSFCARLKFKLKKAFHNYIVNRSTETKPRFFLGRKKWKLQQALYRHIQSSSLKKHLKNADIIIDFKNGESLTHYRPTPDQKKIVWFQVSSAVCLTSYNYKEIKTYDTFICLSKAFKKDFIAGHPWIEGKIHVLYNPFDYNDIQIKAEQNSDLNDDEKELLKQPYYLHVSRIAPDKDIPTLLTAYTTFRKTAKQPIPALYFIGDGQQRPFYQQYIEQNGLSEHIKFIGEKSNPYLWMKNAQALILSSKSEGFGCVLVEALSCHTPVISADCPSAPVEILENGRLGQLFACGEADDLATQLSLLHSGEYTPPSVETIEKSLARFDKDNIINQLCELLDSL